MNSIIVFVITITNSHIYVLVLIFKVIGWNYMNLYNLRVQTEGYSSDYDSTCNPGIFNEFATAAFRFGHSLIRPMLTRMSPNYSEMPSHIRLRDGFFNPDMLYEHSMIDEVCKKKIFILSQVSTYHSFSCLHIIFLQLMSAYT